MCEWLRFEWELNIFSSPFIGSILGCTNVKLNQIHSSTFAFFGQSRSCEGWKGPFVFDVVLDTCCNKRMFRIRLAREAILWTWCSSHDSERENAVSGCGCWTLSFLTFPNEAEQCWGSEADVKLQAMGLVRKQAFKAGKIKEWPSNDGALQSQELKLFFQFSDGLSWELCSDYGWNRVWLCFFFYFF